MMYKLLALGSVLITLVLAACGTVRPSPDRSPTGKEPTVPTRLMEVTFYGWPDNTPPGNTIAYPDIHQTAGGTGTYTDPITFATDAREIAPGTRIYVPYLQKYFIMEDDCTASDIEWSSSGSWHIDIWIGGQGYATVEPEATSLTRAEKQSVLISPPANESVNLRPLLNGGR